ncbi:hypothetical protein CNMCM6936_003278 [Aspergillus lentulus]|nr:hypothetical protein CNMCM6069_003259 [Aspergillus lentulus]KAF4168170.1 hypothetical protein CNMCM6936_003278 [Aspergillus lentulus]KAF4179319.1 hypothetical protein CNMCM8060_003182 [Aspergillus lentulus]KAF4185072.1 hypothetical protein CNMCM7927_007097 [Aspergillus lentulus]KAF4198793.1 hypothetical protein CNMCM8694_008143 [Aspergillus lentulus]
MASYHRVLETFGRSIHDSTLECDCDIHPWELSINGEQRAGKIRLIGFVDVFFLISYSANARYEHGITVYKDKLALEELTGITAHPSPGTPVGNTNAADHQEPEENIGDLEEAGDQANQEDDAEQGQEECSQATERQDSQAGQAKDSGDRAEVMGAPKFRKTSTFSIKSLGHPVGLRASYPRSWIRSYKVEITKPASWGLTKRIMRGLKPHSTYDLMGDVIRCGIITQGQLAGHLMGILLAGSRLDDTTRKYHEAMTAGDGAGRQALSNEKI